jgi:ketose-bisphosphate aldolase
LTDRFENKLTRTMSAAAAAGILVPAFNVPYLPMVEAVCDALARHKTFGIVEVARLEVVKFEARSLADVAKLYRQHADPRYMTLHLDHTPVIDEDGLTVDWRAFINEALELGYDSVMIDGSRLPLDENIAAAAEVVRMAHARGVAVEAELGAVLGHESGPLPPYDELLASKRGFTDPADAARFVRETGVDWLSVSIGSIHGAISGAAKDQAKLQARLDIDHLKLLRAATGIPLVLHGGSGVKQECVDEAIAHGIAKINIGTDIRQPYERALASGGSVKDAQAAVIEAMTGLIRRYGVENSAERLCALAGEP